MTSWLEQARAESAALPELMTVAASATLRTGVDARLRRRRLTRRALIGASLTSAALIVALVLSSTPERQAPPVARAPAPVLPKVAAPAAAVGPVTAPELRFADGSTASALDAHAQLRVDRDDDQTAHVTLASGAARFDVMPRGGKPFVVSAGHVSVHVIGTHFVVTRTSSTSTTVAVQHGIVEVMAGGIATRLAAGEERTFVEEAVSKSPARVARDVVRELLDTADLARKDGRTDDAVSALQTIVKKHRKDPRAPSAAFSLGRVLLETRVLPKEAAAAFALVAKLDAKSPLVEDALAREVEAWARAGDTAKAEALARSYLSRYPNGARSAQVRAHAKLD